MANETTKQSRKKTPEQLAKERRYVNTELLNRKTGKYCHRDARLARAVGIDKTTFGRKLRGETPFNAREIAQLKIELELTDSDIVAIFIDGYLNGTA